MKPACRLFPRHDPRELRRIDLPRACFLLAGLILACGLIPVPPQTAVPARRQPTSTPTVVEPVASPRKGETPTSLPPTSGPVTPPTEVDPTSIIYTQDYSGAQARVERAFISRYGTAVVVCLDTMELHIIELPDGRERKFRMPFPSMPDAGAIAIQASEIFLAEYSLQENPTVVLWRITPDQSGEVVSTISVPDGFVTSLAFSPSGKTLAVGYNFGQVRLYRTRDGAHVRTLEAHIDFVLSMAYSWDGRYLLTDSFSFDPHTYVFDPIAGSRIATLSADSWDPGQVSFSPDGSLAAASAAGGMHIYSTQDWSDTGVAIERGWDGTFTCDGLGFMVPQDDLTSIHSTKTGELVATIASAPLFCLADGRLVAIEVSPDGYMLTLREVGP